MYTKRKPVDEYCSIIPKSGRVHDKNHAPSRYILGAVTELRFGTIVGQHFADNCLCQKACTSKSFHFSSPDREVIPDLSGSHIKQAKVEIGNLILKLYSGNRVCLAKCAEEGRAKCLLWLALVVQEGF